VRVWVSLIVAESERRLSRRRQNKSAFRFQRILCSRRYEIPQTAFPTHGIQDNRQSFRRGNSSILAALEFSHASLSRPPALGGNHSAPTSAAASARFQDALGSMRPSRATSREGQAGRGVLRRLGTSRRPLSASRKQDVPTTQRLVARVPPPLLKSSVGGLPVPASARFRMS
jgi:hypothetical protein